MSAFPHLSHLGHAPDFTPVLITLPAASGRGPALGTALSVIDQKHLEQILPASGQPQRCQPRQWDDLRPGFLASPVPPHKTTCRRANHTCGDTLPRSLKVFPFSISSPSSPASPGTAAASCAGASSRGAALRGCSDHTAPLSRRELGFKGELAPLLRVLGGSAGDVSPREGTARYQRREGLSQASALLRSRVMCARSRALSGMEELASLLFPSRQCKLGLRGGSSRSKPFLRWGLPGRAPSNGKRLVSFWEISAEGH